MVENEEGLWLRPKMGSWNSLAADRSAAADAGTVHHFDAEE
jgi:hypothetical protein